MNWTSYELLMVLWRASWQAAILAVLVYLICRIFQRSISASAKTLLWLLPVLRLVVLIVPASSFSMFNATTVLGNRIFTTLQSQTIPGLKPQHQTLPSQNLPSQAASSTASDNIPTQDIALHDVAPHHSDEHPFATASTDDQANNEFSLRGEQAVTEALSMTLPDNSPFSESISPNVQRFTSADVLVLAWLVGVGICLLRYVWALFFLRKVIQSGKAIHLELIVPPEVSVSMKKLARSVRFIVVENECGPAVAGVVRPVVLLPQRMLDQFSKDELSMVVMHELEHVRRFDTSILFFAQLATILHWFNPLAYWLRKRLQTQVEIAVDATTVRNLGLDRVKQYAELLFKVSSTNTTPAFVLSMARRTPYFRYRIEQLAEIEPRTPLRTLFGAFTIIVLAMTGLSDLASREQNSTQPNSTNTTELISGSVSGTSGEVDLRSANVPQQDETNSPLPAPSNAEPGSSEVLSSLAGEQVTVVTQESTVKAPDKSDNSEMPASAEKSDESDPVSDLLSVSGQVVDSQGKGVPNAKLFYIPDYQANPTEVTTDDAGNFTISYPPRKPYEFESYSTWVLADGFGLRVVAMRRLLHDEKSVKNVKIPLPPLESNATSVEVRDPNGDLLPDALVMPDRIELPNGSFLADEPEGLVTSIPSQLIESLAVRTDKDGKASFNRFPNALWHGIRCESAQFGTQSDESARPLRPAKISLRQVGKIHGRIDSFDPKSFPSLNFFIETTPVPSSPHLKGRVTGKFNEKGEFDVSAIAVGSISNFYVGTVEKSTGNVAEIICENYRSMKVLPDNTLELELTVPPTVRVSGVVLTSDTRVPVPGSVISCYRKNSPHHRQIVTNENGEFEIQVVPGKVRFQMISVSSSKEISRKYASGKFPDVITEDTKLEISLTARKSVKGRLQDALGKPIANQDLWRFGENRLSINGICETDADGNFEMFPVGATIQSEGFWAIVDMTEYRRRAAIKTVVRQISNDGDFYVLEQPSKPIAPPTGK